MKKLPNAWQQERSDEALQRHPYLAELRSKLLSAGGHLVVDWNDFNGCVDEPFVQVLLAFGTFWPTTRVVLRRGQPCHCHDNAIELEVSHPKSYRAITGYGLSDDGLWRPHSWVFNFRRGNLVETTGRRIRYFGIPSAVEKEKT